MAGRWPWWGGRGPQMSLVLRISVLHAQGLCSPLLALDRRLCPHLGDPAGTTGALPTAGSVRDGAGVREAAGVPCGLCLPI